MHRIAPRRRLPDRCDAARLITGLWLLPTKQLLPPSIFRKTFTTAIAGSRAPPAPDGTERPLLPVQTIFLVVLVPPFSY